MEDKASRILRVQGALEAERSTWDSHWQEVADRVMPAHAEFSSKTEPQGQKRTEKIFDSTALLALEKFSAALQSVLTPESQRWQGLTTSDRELNEDQTVKAYLEEVTRLLFLNRYATKANFKGQIHESYKSLGAFGTCCIFIDDNIGRGLRYRAVHLSDCYFMENASGFIDYVHRRIQYTGRQAVERFDKNRLPSKILAAAEKGTAERFDFIHCVKPNGERKPGMRDASGMEFESVYVSVEGKGVVEEGGYRSFPYAVGRYTTAPRETYGRSPAMLVLPDIKMLNEMEKTMMRAGHRSVDPVLLLHGDGALQGFNMTPGALNYGGVDEQGRQLVQPLVTGANLPLSMEMSQQKRLVIEDAFLVRLFQIMVDGPAMTATEVMERAREKGIMLAPTGGRLQTELLGPIIERELDILSQAGALPPMPQALAERGGEVTIEYTSPLQKAQRAEDGIAILRTFEAIAPMVELDPKAARVFKVSDTIRELAEINGVPAKLLHSAEEMQEISDQEDQAQQANSLLQAAPLAGKAAVDFAQAQALAGAAPSSQLPAVIPA